MTIVGAMLLVLLGAAAPPPDCRSTSSRLVEARNLIDGNRYAQAAELAREQLARERACGRSATLEAASARDMLAEALDRAGTARAAEIRELLATSLEIKERRSGRESLEVADTLDLIGSIFVDIDTRWAGEASARALGIREKLSRPDNVGIAGSCEGMARLYLADARPWLADSYAKRALEIRQARLGRLHPDTIRSLLLHAELQVALMDCGDARRMLDQAQETLAQIGEPALQTAALARSLTVYQFSCGNPADGEAHIRRALEIDESVLGKDHPAIAQDLRALGGFHREDESYPLRARALLEKAFGPDDPRLAAVFEDLGLHELAVGNTGAARESFDRAAALLAASHGDKSQRLAEFRCGTSAMLMTIDPATARMYCERHLTALEEQRGVPLHFRARAHQGVGMAYAWLNDYRIARRHLDRAVALFDRFTDDETRFIDILMGAAETAGYGGDPARGKLLSWRAANLVEKKHGPESIELADTLQGLSAIYIIDKDYAGAAPVIERAIAIAEKASTPEKDLTGWCVRRRCELKNRIGDYRAARPACERALRLLEPPGSTTADVMLRLELAVAEMGVGDARAALERALDTAARERQQFLGQFERLSEREALAYPTSSAVGVNLWLLATADPATLPPRAVRQVWDALVRSRALVLDEMASRVRLLQATKDPKVAALFDTLTASRGKLARLSVRDPVMSAAAAVDAFYAAKADVEAAERELAVRSVELRRRRVERTLGFEDVAAALPPGAALVSYAKFRAVEPNVDDPTQYVALVLPPGSREPRVVPLGAAEKIDALVAAWRQRASAPPPSLRSAARGAEDDYLRAAKELRKAVWDPLQLALGNPDLVLVVPDGALGLVNFATLPAPDGSYLAEGRTALHVVSAERDIAALSLPRRKGSGLLLVGGPDFDRASSDLVALGASPGAGVGGTFRGQTPSCAAFRSQQFAPLPRTLLEVDEVAALWDSQLDSRDAGLVTKLTHALAAEAMFKRLAPASRVLHVATHGVFLEESCGEQADPAAAAAGVDRMPDAASREALRFFAALALAGANRREQARADEDDGILTAEEVASLDLTSVEWAVLSACESAAGKALGGEGVFGLRRAFQVAGARTLIASLWKVRDEDTRLWMQKLYRARADGASTAGAVREADLALIRARRTNGLSTHPFYWGAFVASGDWR